MKKMTCLIFFSLMALGPAVWAIPNQITYQGTLKDKGFPANSPPDYAMTFQLTDQTGNNPYSNVISSPVTVTNGLFSAQLNFQLLAPNTWDTINPYLKVTVNNQTLSPTEPISATAYAFVSNTVVNGAISSNKLDQTVQDSLSPTGAVMAYAGQSAPGGWLICDGSAVSRTRYPGLFAAIGNIWGPGDGSTTFNLPDLRGRAPIGAGQGPGLTNRPVGEALGEEKHVLSIDEMPSHNHEITDPGHTHALNPVGALGVVAVQNSGPNQGLTGGGSGGGSWSVTGTISSTTGITINNTGGGLPFNKMPPYTAINYIIKT